MASVYKRGGKANRNGKWKIAYFDENGKRRCVTGCRDRAATDALARKLEADVLLRKRGIVDAKAEKLVESRTRPIEEHISDFEAVLNAKGNTAKHIAGTLKHIRDAVEDCGFRTVGDFDSSALSRHVKHLKERELSARTVNARLTSLKSFSAWLFRTERLRTDPFKQVAKLNARTDRRLRRRALTEEEICRLLTSTWSAPFYKGLYGTDRAMLYRLAIETGLRVSEIASLTKESFDLSDLSRATVTVEAAYSKRKREDVLPLRGDCAAALLDYLAQKAPGRAFPLPPRPAEMLRQDLARAGIESENASGHVIDFHALRHTAITRLARSGIAPSVAKDLARHSTITLTMDTYTHTLIEDRRTALDKLPSMERAGASIAEATGTDDSTATAPATAVVLPEGATPDNSCHNTCGGGNTEGLSQGVAGGGVRQGLSSSGMKNESGPSRTRTYDTRIMSPLL